jgi:hypothetical protein
LLIYELFASGGSQLISTLVGFELSTKTSEIASGASLNDFKVSDSNFS